MYESCRENVRKGTAEIWGQPPTTAHTSFYASAYTLDEYICAHWQAAVLSSASPRYTETHLDATYAFHTLIPSRKLRPHHGAVRGLPQIRSCKGIAVVDGDLGCRERVACPFGLASQKDIKTAKVSKL